MTERRRQPARLRAFQQIARELAELERKTETVMERRNALMLADQESDDPSSTSQIAAALGRDDSTVRVTFKRLREKVGPT